MFETGFAVRHGFVRAWWFFAIQTQRGTWVQLSPDQKGSAGLNPLGIAAVFFAASDRGGILEMREYKESA